ncbi:MAG: beta-eliminating lyase-related protein, partial [Peptococcales bacterium]
GSEDFISKARKYRKMLGGGLRQAGILAAAGIYALENLVARLKEDHQNATRLAKALNELPGLSVPLETVQTNIVMVDINHPKLNAIESVKVLQNKGILVNNTTQTRLRFVTHRDVSCDDIEVVIKAMKEIFS